MKVGRIAENLREADVREMVKTKLQKQEARNLLYTEDFLNRKGYKLGSKEPYTEVIADELIKNYELVKLIGGLPIRRTKSFNNNRSGVATVAARLERKGELGYNEKLLAVALFNSGKEYGLGKIFDYEVPIKEKGADKFGKIDLVAMDNLNHAINLIELKINPRGNNKDKDKNVNGETLLRTLLEIYTYYKLISGSYDKFLKDYGLSREQYNRFQPVILTEEGTPSAETLSNLKEYPRIQSLISEMNKELNEIKTDTRLKGFIFNYSNSGKPFYNNGERQQKIMLQVDITINPIIMP